MAAKRQLHRPPAAAQARSPSRGTTSSCTSCKRPAPSLPRFTRPAASRSCRRRFTTRWFPSPGKTVPISSRCLQPAALAWMQLPHRRVMMRSPLSTPSGRPSWTDSWPQSSPRSPTERRSRTASRSARAWRRSCWRFAQAMGPPRHRLHSWPATSPATTAQPRRHLPPRFSPVGRTSSHSSWTARHSFDPMRRRRSPPRRTRPR